MVSKRSLLLFLIIDQKLTGNRAISVLDYRTASRRVSFSRHVLDSHLNNRLAVHAGTSNISRHQEVREA